MFKLIKKILKWIVVIILIFLIFNTIYKKHINSINDVSTRDMIINEYHQKYPISDYVEESLDSSGLYINFVIQSMLNYEQFENSYTSKEKLNTVMYSVFNKEYNYVEQVYGMQYVEEKLLTLEEVEDNETHNYKFIVKNDMNKEVQGNVAIYGEEEDVNLVISLVDSSKNIDINKARVLVDDSNAELLAYLIIEQTQKLYKTDLEPNEACKYFYGSSLEKLAGDISYHAVVAYFLEAYNVQDNKQVYEKVKEININKNDTENFYMSRKY